MTLLCLKMSILTRMLATTFNVYFLLIQIFAQLLAIGLVAKRPIIVTLICPTMISTILVDAVPQSCRRYVTFVSLFMIISFSVSFVIAMMGSLLDVSNELSFTINSMELSGKALAFTCSLNLLAFCFRSMWICLFYPGCLVFYSCNVKSKRYDPQKRISSFWRDDGDNNDKTSTVKKEEKKDPKLYWTVRPKYETTIIRTKQTIAAKFFGMFVCVCVCVTYLLRVLHILFLFSFRSRSE